MQTEVSKPGAALIIGVTIVGIIVVGLCYAYGPAAQQRRNMALARKHCDMLTRQLADDPRFEFVEFTYTTAENMTVQGFVGSEEDLAELKDTVVASDPPIRYAYNVYVEDLMLLRDEITVEQAISNKTLEATNGTPQ